MKFTATSLAGAVIVEPEFRADARGGFARAFCREEFTANGLDPHIEQANLSTNRTAGTVRGLHYQLPPHAESKLVRCIQGALFDVVVDLREDSPTFGRWEGVELTAENHLALLVPEGCAHGFQTLLDDTTALYHVSAAYAPNHESGVHHLDPDIAVTWPHEITMVSDRDGDLPGLAEITPVALAGPDDRGHRGGAT